MTSRWKFKVHWSGCVCAARDRSFRPLITDSKKAVTCRHCLKHPLFVAGSRPVSKNPFFEVRPGELINLTTVSLIRRDTTQINIYMLNGRNICIRSHGDDFDEAIAKAEEVYQDIRSRIERFYS